MSFSQTVSAKCYYNTRDLLLHVKGSTPARELWAYQLPFDVQVIPFKINVRKEKWLFSVIDRPQSHNSHNFLNILYKIYRLFIQPSMIIS